ncbi:uncharacterized protein LOC134183259 [Corticium candelabrum]|uniref:uncharacterized protein LOC134183259 n=1 Tax=Corticium candelabrum TaxID=121492 RepID=UPI002E26C792|nr:uncharacterized protein LOC134183259 [Corticium candelabrum]
MAAVSTHRVENKLRSAVKSRQVRVNEFFKDFDRLRNGFITRDQFQRCLNQHFRVMLSEDELRSLIAKYDEKRNGMVNYKSFCDVIDSSFNPNLLDSMPELQLSAMRLSSEHQLDSGSIEKTNELLRRCSQYYKYRGVKVKDCYEDFDRHHIGLVTESQFYRSFPGPPDVTEDELRLLASRYYDPGPKLYNFLLFHSDVENLEAAAIEERRQARGIAGDKGRGKGTDLQAVFNKLRVTVYKDGIRTTEFFRDHDKLRSGLITENQFVCGLSLCCEKSQQLTREEVQLLINCYRNDDGRVKYREFCDAMENAFNEPELEKKPTHEVVRPLRGVLAWSPNQLSPSDESHMVQLLSRLSDIVRKRRLLIYPMFKDFDRGKGYTRGVTKPQFSRILHFMSLQMSDEDIKLICRKFENQTTGDVNYSAFIQAIDSEYTGQVVEEEKPATVESPDTSLATMATSDMTEASLLELIDRIKHHVKVNRIRVCEFFQDFDPLNTGSITKGRFRQAISAMEYNITQPQFNSLSARYIDLKHTDCILWKQFVGEVDAVFTQPNLEATPTHCVPNVDKFTVTRLGERDWRDVSERERDVLEGALIRLREKTRQRRVLTKPCFQDFDRHNHGYITSAQFRQCLSCLNFTASDEEVKLIEERFSDDEGVNYVKFLAEIEPTEREEPKYTEYVRTLQALQENKKRTVAQQTSVNIDELMIKIKTKVSRERIRVLEFMRDYDKLRTGRMLKTAFPRALDLCSFLLTPSEVEALITKYEYPDDPSYVEYLKFSNDMEATFTTKDLEKMPLLEVQPFVPPVAVNQNVLTREDETMLDFTMHRLAERVRVRSIQTIPLFEDYDKVHIGSVSRSQFHRVLSELELSSLVSTHEFKVIYKRFNVQVGGKDDVNYIAFCDMIDAYAQFVWRERLQ